MYSDPRDMTPQEKEKKKRQLAMQQVSYQSDLKKIEREKLELKDELRRLEQEKSRLEVYIKESEEKIKKNTEKETYFNDELRRIKKQLIEIG
jgi:septal ring factor EnvC (AmiA/AmiB activator)